MNNSARVAGTQRQRMMAIVPLLAILLTLVGCSTRSTIDRTEEWVGFGPGWAAYLKLEYSGDTAAGVFAASLYPANGSLKHFDRVPVSGVQEGTTTHVALTDGTVVGLRFDAVRIDDALELHFTGLTAEALKLTKGNLAEYDSFATRVQAKPNEFEATGLARGIKRVLKDVGYAVTGVYCAKHLLVVKGNKYECNATIEMRPEKATIEVLDGAGLYRVHYIELERGWIDCGCG